MSEKFLNNGKPGRNAMKGWIRRRVIRLALVTTALLAAASGIAYATIPDECRRCSHLPPA
jgi:hypothetical protein